MIGTTVGNLRIIAELGRGGMGTVYLAEHTKLGRRFAVKRLSSDLTEDSRFRERFFREARHQALLDHPNIVRVTDFIEQDGQYFLVMDYVEGQSLDKLIKQRGRLAEAEALRILTDVLEALNHAHTKAVIHRDIKPANILIDENRRARITDFGIAILAGEERLTRTGGDIGSPWYMSPEQIRSPREIDHRSDVYALGIVAYEMLTGELPFDAETDYGVKEQHLRAPVPDPRKKNPEIPEELAEIILASLEKDPDERTPGCLQFLTSVKKYQGKQAARNDGLIEERRGEEGGESDTIRAIPVTRYAGGIAVVALLLGLAWYVFNWFPDCNDIVCLLEEDGYTVNIGLTPNYVPGNILQVAEPAPDDGEQRLASPLVFAWHDQCFPSQLPRRSSSVEFKRQADLSASLSLGDKTLGKLLPGVTVDGNVVADYSLELKKAHLVSFARSELNRGLSESCVRKLIQALEDGDRIEWFAVIIEAVVAEGATWHMRWKAGTSLQAQATEEQGIMEGLGRIGWVSEADSQEGIRADDTQTTDVSVNGPIVIGYRTRPLQPVYEE